MNICIDLAPERPAGFLLVSILNDHQTRPRTFCHIFIISHPPLFQGLGAIFGRIFASDFSRKGIANHGRGIRLCHHHLAVGKVGKASLVLGNLYRIANGWRIYRA